MGAEGLPMTENSNTENETITNDKVELTPLEQSQEIKDMMTEALENDGEVDQTELMDIYDKYDQL
jgi:hypothetical protein